ncbi:fungal pheromone mating factor STE2 GPCR-domain-containing protein [Hypoxylon trugodes]|uniref:fungal pheromone mating factor STE2 GPCR-domain-containing protein n=1 Tax=Hypoxylon trugodes TaxID=326681 RepID=UPI0021913EFD|nr:fungal pheromone mating factor STE2 GPCR-domain-containing protein [Hypoxylon trugodes]KAI1389289.1 fungal pheromone mating factor STE2 GPCR-domain-containing protein [Hypoxylon trugodes]
MDDFDPRNQTFTILGHPNTSTSPPPQITISMSIIDAQRIRLANTSINYGVQLGLCLFSLLTTLLLLPTRKLRRPVHLTQGLCLVVSVVRLAILVLYFPGPLTEYYVAWTRDASVLTDEEYGLPDASAVLGVVQLALVEAALAVQSSVLVRTWGMHCKTRNGGKGSDGSGSSTLVGVDTEASVATTATRTRGVIRGKCWWRPPVICMAVFLAVAAVGLRAVWAAHWVQALKGHTLPVPLDSVGAASSIVGAASVFYFCGIFFAHLALHLAATRRILRSKKSKGTRKLSMALTLGDNERGLTSLEILAVGNGVLMLAPCLFAGLDVAAGPGNTKVLPFDAGSWVQTLVAAGLPLISIAAHYRGSDSAGSRVNSLHNSQFGMPSPSINLSPDTSSNTRARMMIGGRRKSSGISGISGGSINGDGREKRRRRSSRFFVPGETRVSFSSPFRSCPPNISPFKTEAADLETLAGGSSNRGVRSPHLARTSFAVPPEKSAEWRARSPTDDRNLNELGVGDIEIESEGARDGKGDEYQESLEKDH